MTGGGASARKRGATSCAQRAGNLRDAVINHFASALACLNLLRQRSVSVCVLVEDVRFTETNAKDFDGNTALHDAAWKGHISPARMKYKLKS